MAALLAIMGHGPNGEPASLMWTLGFSVAFIVVVAAIWLVWRRRA